jgi:hypothetical protein
VRAIDKPEQWRCTYIPYLVNNMPLGLVNDDDFLREIERLNKKEEVPLPVPMAIVKEPVPLGRPPGKENTPEIVREVVATLQLEGAPSKIVGQAFGVTEDSARAYKNGATSLATYNEPSPKLHEHVLSTKEKIAKIAARKLRQSLRAISEDKIKDLSPNKAAQLAKDMSAIVKDMTSDGDDGNKGVQVVFFSPRPEPRDSYERIVVNE